MYLTAPCRYACSWLLLLSLLYSPVQPPVCANRMHQHLRVFKIQTLAFAIPLLGHTNAGGRWWVRRGGGGGRSGRRVSKLVFYAQSTSTVIAGRRGNGGGGVELGEGGGRWNEA